MRWFAALVLALALGVMGCGRETGEVGTCADWVGDWTITSISCDDVASDVTGVELSVAADCTGETILMISATCEEIIQMTFTPGAGDTTIVDNGANTCGAECASHECEAIADTAQPYAATVTVSGDTWTATALVTQQMVSDEFTPCEVGQTMVTVAVPR